MNREIGLNQFSEPNTQSAKATRETSTTTASRESRRDQMMEKQSSQQQVDIMKWAETHGIRENDSMWLLVDLLGITQAMTDTLPNRITAAGLQVVELIAQQRRAEGEAFSLQAQKVFNQSLDKMTQKVAAESQKMTAARLRNKLMLHGLLVSAGILFLVGICFVGGYFVGSQGAGVPWWVPPAKNAAFEGIQLILLMPMGYMLMLLILAAILMGVMIYLKDWLAWRAEQKSHEIRWD